MVVARAGGGMTPNPTQLATLLADIRKTAAAAPITASFSNRQVLEVVEALQKRIADLETAEGLLAATKEELDKRGRIFDKLYQQIQEYLTQP